MVLHGFRTLHSSTRDHPSDHTRDWCLEESCHLCNAVYSPRAGPTQCLFSAAQNMTGHVLSDSKCYEATRHWVMRLRVGMQVTVWKAQRHCTSFERSGHGTSSTNRQSHFPTQRPTLHPKLHLNSCTEQQRDAKPAENVNMCSKTEQRLMFANKQLDGGRTFSGLNM